MKFSNIGRSEDEEVRRDRDEVVVKLILSDRSKAIKNVGGRGKFGVISHYSCL